MPEAWLTALCTLLFMSETAGSLYTEELFSMGWQRARQCVGSGALHLHSNLFHLQKRKKKLVSMQQPEFYKTEEEEQHRESDCI